MTPDPGKAANGGPSGLEGLKDALGGYLSAKGSGLTDRAGAGVKGLTQRLTGLANGSGGGGDEGGGGGGGGGDDESPDGKAKGGSGSGAGGGSVKATHIMESVDVGVPLRTAYDQWTRFEDFSRFTKGVRSVSKNDETNSDWNVKVGPSARSWKAKVQEQVPDERIVWTSEGAKGSTTGSITFHSLAPSLTRIIVVVEYYPAGFFEKTGNLWRAQGRRLRLDLKHFVRFVTLQGEEEIEGWRGEIREGEVVKTHEEAMEEEEAAQSEDDGDGGDDEDGEYDDDHDGDGEETDAENNDEDYDENGEYEDENGEEHDEDIDRDEGDEEDSDDAERPRPRSRPRSRPRR
ncbi:SRPBCC family protein [Streptomyces ziwulingensis]|uniref:Coenzyme Q-binding protein COQ10 START domain-containing protein n=1 Tax=Streptomyces ziwulingensis TaxID=1045501 RepID=A0ABP9B4I1_9ACTN